MANTTWQAGDFELLGRLERRASSLPSDLDRASALRASADRIPDVCLWRAWPLLLILTIAGVHARFRNTRTELAHQLAHHITADELLTASIVELQAGHGPSYLRHLLSHGPGAVWSRCTYPLPWVCGRILDRPRAEAASLLALRAARPVEGESGATEGVPHMREALVARQAQAWQEARALLSHPDCTDAIRAQLRARIGDACVG